MSRFTARSDSSPEAPLSPHLDPRGSCRLRSRRGWQGRWRPDARPRDRADQGRRRAPPFSCRGPGRAVGKDNLSLPEWVQTVKTRRVCSRSRVALMTLQTFPMVGHLRLIWCCHSEDGTMSLYRAYPTRRNDAYNVNDRDGLRGPQRRVDDWFGVSIPYKRLLPWRSRGDLRAVSKSRACRATFHIPHQGELTASSLRFARCGHARNSDAEVFNYCLRRGHGDPPTPGRDRRGRGRSASGESGSLRADGRTVPVKWVGCQDHRDAVLARPNACNPSGCGRGLVGGRAAAARPGGSDGGSCAADRRALDQRGLWVERRSIDWVPVVV